MDRSKAKKVWTLRFRAVDRKNFLEIEKGLKSVETRAATPKYCAVKKGDVIRIVCGARRLERNVKRVRVFASIGALTKAVPFKKIMPSAASLAEVRATYDGYPGYREKLKKHGVIAFFI